MPLSCGFNLKTDYYKVMADIFNKRPVMLKFNT